mgnify:CR=1 FL=1
MELLCYLSVYMILIIFGFWLIAKKREWFDNIFAIINRLSVSKVCAVLFLTYFLLDSIHIFYKYLPFIADEVYTLSGGAFFAGYDWSSYMSYHKFYNFGYTMLLSPLFRLIENPIILYKSLLIVNVFLQCISVILIYRMLRLRFRFDNVKSIIFALTACSSVLILQYHTYVYSEMPLTILVWVVLAIMIRLVESERKSRVILSLLLGFFLGYTYIIHSRCAVIIVTTVIVILLYLLVYRKWLTQPICTAFSFSAMILLGKKLIAYVQVNLYLKDSAINMPNSVEAAVTGSAGTHSRYELLKSFEGIYKIIKQFFSLAGALNIATGGFLLIITIVALYCIIKYRKSFLENDIGKKNFILAIYSFVGLWGMVACIAMIGANNGYARFLVYSRYFTPFFGTFLLFGIIMLIKNKDLKQSRLWLWTIAGEVIVIAIYIFFSFPVMDGKKMNQNGTLYIFRCFSVHKEQTRFTWSVIAIALLVMVAGSIVFLICYRKKRVLPMCMILFGFSIIMFCGIEDRQNRDSSQRRYNMSNATAALLDELQVNEDITMCFSGTEMYNKAILVTLFNKNCKYVDDMNTYTDLENTILFTNKPEDYPVKDNIYTFQLDDNEYLLTGNEGIYNQLERSYKLIVINE